MRPNLWGLVIFVAVAACGRAPETSDQRGDGSAGDNALPDPTTPPPGPETPPPAPEVRTLTLKLGTVSLAPGEKAFFYLGDGTKHFFTYASGAAVVFDDVDLPQDLTLVVRDDVTGNVAVSTLLGVDRRELDLGKNAFAAKLNMPAETPATDWVDATVQGQLSMPGLVTGVVRARGTGLKTQTQQMNGAGFTLRAKGPKLQSVDLVAVGLNSAGDASFGVKAAVPVQDDQTTMADISLDHPADQLFTVTATNEDLFGGVYSSRLVFAPGGSTKASEILFASVVDRVLGPNPPPFVGGHSSADFAAMPAGAMDRRVVVHAGKLVAADDTAAMDPEIPYGQVSDTQPATATDADVTFLAPGLVTAPELGTKALPGAATLPLTLAWDGDDAATLVTVDLRGTGFSWTVQAAGATRALTLPSLPAAVGLESLPSGAYQIGLRQKRAKAFTSHTQYWDPAAPAEGDTKVTQQWGFLAVP